MGLAVLIVAAIAVYTEVSPDANSKSLSCPGAESRQVLREYAHTGNLETDLFESATGRFIVSYEFPDVDSPGSGPQPSLHVAVEDESGKEVMGNTALGAVAAAKDSVRGTDSEAGKHEFAVGVLPGSYRLNIDAGAWDKRYALTVEECRVSEVS